MSVTNQISTQQGQALIDDAIASIAPVLRRTIPEEQWTQMTDSVTAPCGFGDSANYRYNSSLFKATQQVDHEVFTEIQEILAGKGFRTIVDPPEFGEGFHAKFYNDRGDYIGVTSGPDSGTSYDGATECRLLDPSGTSPTP